jgi:CRISPR-associated protein Cmr5
MSPQQSKEQERARGAWNCVQAVKERNEQLPENKRFAKEYGALAKNAPADIQMNGLGQTLSFWRAKGMKQNKPKDDGDNEHWKLYEHISEWVMNAMKQTPKDGLMKWVMDETTSTNQYRQATAEAMAFLQWLKRFAEAELSEEKTQ